MMHAPVAALQSLALHVLHEDFAPIDAAFTKLFKGKGWMK